jgi:transcriptional regulator with XRE-family HTH domain
MTPKLRRSIDWSKTDSAIARETGLSRQLIGYHRQQTAHMPHRRGHAEPEPLPDRSWIVAELDCRRKSKGLTITALAELAGMKTQDVSAILMGRQNASLASIDKLIHALGGQAIHPKLSAYLAMSGWSQRQFADRLELHASKVSTYFNGRSSPRLSVAERILKELNIANIDWSQRHELRA